jgi:hypothetical protein
MHCYMLAAAATCSSAIVTKCILCKTLPVTQFMHPCLELSMKQWDFCNIVHWFLKHDWIGILISMCGLCLPGGLVRGNITVDGHPKDPVTFARISGYVEQV